jgi:hypothetical protein
VSYILFLLLLLVLIVLFLIKSNLIVTDQAKKNYKPTSHIRKINLEGVWFNEGDRKEAFAEVQEGDIVNVTFDYGNSHDRNALGVYTRTGKLLGYIPRDNKRTIGAFRRQPQRKATIIHKYNGKSQREKEIRIELSIA